MCCFCHTAHANAVLSTKLLMQTDLQHRYRQLFWLVSLWKFNRETFLIHIPETLILSVCILGLGRLKWSTDCGVRLSAESPCAGDFKKKQFNVQRLWLLVVNCAQKLFVRSSCGRSSETRLCATSYVRAVLLFGFRSSSCDVAWPVVNLKLSFTGA